MTNTRNTGRIKKYGVCLNDKCEKYKVVQEIVHGDLECPECKKKLSPCAPPKQKSSKKPLYIGIAAIVIIGGILTAIFASRGKNEPKSTTDIVVVDSDSIRAAQQTVIEQARLDSIEKACQDSIEQSRLDSIEKTRLDSIEQAKEKNQKSSTPRPA